MKNQYDKAVKTGKIDTFNQELMLRIMSDEDRLIEDTDIQWYYKADLMRNRAAYNFYITTDFATSTKKSADYSTIGVWAINNNGDWMLVDGQAKRQTMQDNINDVFDYVRKWKPLSVGIETSGQQGGFLSIIDEEMQRRNVYFSLAKKQGSKEPGIRPAKDKVHRFVTGVQPRFKQGKVWLPKPEVCKTTNLNLLGLVEELVHELSRFTLAGGVKALAHDDALDLLNQLSEMELYAPSDAADDEYFTNHNKSSIWADWTPEENRYEEEAKDLFPEEFI